MKRLGLLVTVIVLLVGMLPAHAQDGGNRFTWTLYDFSVTLPDGWTVSGTAARLVMGSPDDVRAVLDGNPPVGTIVEVRIVEPPTMAYDDQTTLMYAPRTGFNEDPEQSERQFGENRWPAVDIPPIGVRQGLIVTVAETFLVTASAPVEQWADALSTINSLVATIQATSVQPTAAQRLTQNFVWRELSFKTPSNWEIYGLVDLNGLLLSTQANRLELSRTFRPHGLLLSLHDFSAVGHLLTPESILSLKVFMYNPERYEFGEIETRVDIPGFEAVGVSFVGFTDDGEMDATGQAILLRTPESVYLFVGIAGPTEWEASERALFEAMLATLELNNR